MPTDDERVRRLSAAGWSLAQIAAELNTTTRTVSRARERLHIAKPMAPPLTAEEWAAAERLLDDGCSLAEAARTIGRSQRALQRRYSDRTWTHAEAARFARMVSPRIKKPLSIIAANYRRDPWELPDGVL